MNRALRDYENVFFLLNFIPSQGDTDLVLKLQRHLETKVSGRLLLMIITAIKAKRDGKTQAELLDHPRGSGINTQC